MQQAGSGAEEVSHHDSRSGGTVFRSYDQSGGPGSQCGQRPQPQSTSHNLLCRSPTFILMTVLYFLQNELKYLRVRAKRHEIVVAFGMSEYL